jgi:Asp-tRNA(Asn)/Glu-tRNA(Gln) amidotransferase C subunit
MDFVFLRQLCKLCALKLSPKEEVTLLKDIQKIASEFEVLCELPPFGELPDESRIYFREDYPLSISASDRKLLLTNFPACRDSFLQIPSLLDTEPGSED